MPLAAILFSMIASLLVAITGHRDTQHAPRLTAASIVLLLAFPLFSLLPKLTLLPATIDSSSDPALSTSSLFHLIWLGISMLLGLRLLLSALTLERWRRASRKIGKIQLNGRRSVELRILEQIDSPVAAGVLRPLIFLPASWQNWSTETRQMVLAHELAHHRRGDPLWRWLGALACLLHWFNPLVWWLTRRHTIQAEFACDAIVVSTGIRPASYATLLCDLASNTRHPLPSASIAEASSLRARVTRLMAPPGATSPALTAFLILATIATALAFSLLRRAEPAPSLPIPAEEIQLRLSANPFPANP